MSPENEVGQAVELRAGPLTMLFEGGGLRYVRLGGREVLRRVYVAVRDRNWGTVQSQISNLKFEIEEETFRVEFDCLHRRADVDFRWRGTVTGADDGTVVFDFDGEAQSDFLRNRIGFCVLHPVAECAGRPCEITHTGGEVEPSRFPQEIAPHQPFKDVRAITHEVLPGLRATVRMEGETFETEDHRNWTDWSFKTYGTPLDLPFPVAVRAGEKFSQRVTLSLSGGHSIISAVRRSATSLRPAEVALSVESEGAQKLPRIGLGLASHGEPLTAREAARLRALGLAHLRVDLCPSEADFELRLERAAAESAALGVGLEAAIFLSDAADEELDRVLEAARHFRPRVAAWLIFSAAERVTDARRFRLARERLREWDERAVVGAGTNLWFTEINRARPLVRELAREADLLCYAVSPQVHADDDLTLVENLEAQAATVEGARRLFGAVPVAVTPVTLRPRFSASATGPEVAPDPGELPPPVDARQPTLFAAAWTLGSIKYLAEGGAASVTFYETTGWRGVIECESGAPLPDKFPSLPGAVFPLWHVLAGVGEFAGGEVFRVQSSDPLKVIALRLCRAGRTRTLVANLTADGQLASLAAPGSHVRARRLNAQNLSAALLEPQEFRASPGDGLRVEGGELKLRLSPYEVVQLDEQP
jgi:D-apionolactonase